MSTDKGTFAGSSRPPSSGRMKRGRVLVVDDELSARLTMEGVLSDEWHVTVAPSGEAALEILARSSDITVICTDLRMPGMLGSELLGRVLDESRAIAGILITGHRDYLVNVDKRGQAYDLLVKPYDPMELLRSVARGHEKALLRQTLLDFKRARGTR